MSIYYIDKEETLRDLGKHLLQYKVLGVDTETSGLDVFKDELLLLQIGNEFDQYVINYQKLKHADWETIKEVLRSNTIEKIFHNAKFDYKFIKHFLKVDTEQIRDTMVAAHILKAGLKYSGFSLSKLLSDFGIVKDLEKETRKEFIGKVTSEFTEKEITYAALDVKYLPKLHNALLDFIQQYNLTNVYNLECSCIPVTGDMEYNGIYLDYNKWIKLEKQNKEERLKIIKKLDEYALKYYQPDLFGNPNLNYNSHVVVADLLSKELGMEIESTENSVLSEIDHPLVDLILEYRKHSKRIDTYGSAFYNQHVHPVTKRIHARFNQTGGTDTGRYSCDKPNLQNIPATAEYRAAFCAQYPDWKIVGADYSGMELRLLAEFSQDPAFMDIFLKDLDPHCHVASLIMGIPIRKKGTKYIDENGEIKVATEDANIELRKVGKAINFGIAYGMGPGRLAKAIKKTYEEAKDILENFWSKFPGIKRFLDDAVNKALAEEKATSYMDGRIRWLKNFDFMNKGHVAHASNIAKNMSFQSGNASITKRALVRIREKIKENNWTDKCKIINTVHDEIILECHESISEDVKAMLETEMVEAAYEWVKNIPIIAEAYIADHWQK